MNLEETGSFMWWTWLLIKIASLIVLFGVGFLTYKAWVDYVSRRGLYDRNIKGLSVFCQFLPE